MLCLSPIVSDCQDLPSIQFFPFKDTIFPLDAMFANLIWGNSLKKKMRINKPDWNSTVQVRRIAPDTTTWLNRDPLSEVSGFGISDEDGTIEIDLGYETKRYFMIKPAFPTIMGMLPDEFLSINNRILLSFKPGVYVCRHIYHPLSRLSKDIVTEFTFTVLDSPPADEAALYDFLIKNDLANYIHHHRYAPENIPLFEEALLLAPETSSLKPFIHQAVADLLTRQLYNAPKPYSDEELAVLYERIVYHMRKVVESKHPYLLQNLSTDLSNYQFELQAVKARLRRK